MKMKAIEVAWFAALLTVCASAFGQNYVSVTPVGKTQWSKGSRISQMTTSISGEAKDVKTTGLMGGAGATVGGLVTPAAAGIVMDASSIVNSVEIRGSEVSNLTASIASAKANTVHSTGASAIVNSLSVK